MKRQQTLVKRSVALILSLLGTFPAEATIFGDSNNLNGIEDQRHTREDLGEWPNEFKSIGRVFCDGAIQGSAVLFKQKLGKGKSVPRLITARHVMESFEVGDCYFGPESFSWTRSPIVSVVFSGEQEDSQSAAYQSIVSKYDTDWVAMALDVWEGWSSSAIELTSLSSNALQFEGGLAYMVSFDVVRNQMVVHSDCHFGRSEQSSLLGGSANLYWDDCDSTQGGSGGALFIETKGGYQLIGLRVGSLFDEAITGGEPDMGSSFDLDANINVSRAISGEMFEPVCTFAEKGCEPVGNTDSWVESD